MVALRNSRHLRRFGYGIALGAGIAFAPFAIAAASADPGAAHAGAQPAAAVAVPHVQQVVVPKAVVAKPVAAKPVAVKPAAVKPVAVKPAAAPKPAPRSQAAADRGSVVVIGASVSSGRAVSASSAYPRQVGAMSGRNVYVSARSGAGYADGSIARLTQAANLPARNPSLVVLQAGTNDVGAPPALIAGQVRQVVSTVRQQAPDAKIAVVTVFPSIHKGAAARNTDAAIVGAARAVDPNVAVISPLAEGWTYRASADGHPGAAAHERIAERVAGLV